VRRGVVTAAEEAAADSDVEQQDYTRRDKIEHNTRLGEYTQRTRRRGNGTPPGRAV